MLAVGRLGSMFRTLSPSDVLYGNDLSDPDEFARIVRVSESKDVNWVHTASWIATTKMLRLTQRKPKLS
jgi:hypothetical protein